MALLARNVPLDLDEPEEALVSVLAKRLRISADAIRQCSPVRRSLDARDKSCIHFVYHLEFTLADGAKAEAALLRRRRVKDVHRVVEQAPSEPGPGSQPLVERPVVIGFGPAGMFAALTLARRGYCPIVYERGRDVRQRHADVLEKYLGEGVFNPESNLLFGEGGAGAYSDGKLYTRVSDGLVHTVLETLRQHGAERDILIEAKPHIGSEKLPAICRRLREAIESLGGEVRFGSKLTDVRIADGVLEGIRVNESWEPAGPVILAVGHSARDTMRMLAARGVVVQAKPFQMGVRIEHAQEAVNRWQYGGQAGHDRLPPAEYQLVARSAAGDLGNMFSFCMCPGGWILPCNESAGEVATNGASPSKRSGRFANAGLVITIPPRLVGGGALDGLAYQEHWERLAFEAAGGAYRVPAQRAADFLRGRSSDGQLDVSYPLGGQWADIRQVIPPEVADTLQRGLEMLDKRMPGFAGPDAIVVAPESRASSPVRMVRIPETRLAAQLDNLYPVGEGAGYAGGIVSSAVDGIRTAHAVVQRYAPVKP